MALSCVVTVLCPLLVLLGVLPAGLGLEQQHEHRHVIDRVRRDVRTDPELFTRLARNRNTNPVRPLLARSGVLNASAAAENTRRATMAGTYLERFFYSSCQPGRQQTGQADFFSGLCHPDGSGGSAKANCQSPSFSWTFTEHSDETCTSPGRSSDCRVVAAGQTQASCSSVTLSNCPGSSSVRTVGVGLDCTKGYIQPGYDANVTVHISREYGCTNPTETKYTSGACHPTDSGSIRVTCEDKDGPWSYSEFVDKECMLPSSVGDDCLVSAWSPESKQCLSVSLPGSCLSPPRSRSFTQFFTVDCSTATPRFSTSSVLLLGALSLIM
jgi:hypothetical protein